MLVGEVVADEQRHPPGKRCALHEGCDRRALAAAARLHFGDHLAVLHHEVEPDDGILQEATDLAFPHRHTPEMHRQSGTLVLEDETLPCIDEGADERTHPRQSGCVHGLSATIGPTHVGAVRATGG